MPSAADIAPNVRTSVKTTCAWCGTVCEDAEATVENNRVVDVRNICPAGRDRLLQRRDSSLPAALIAGKSSSSEEAIAKSATILSAARFPVIYGLSATTTAVQRVACALADRIGATIDSDSAWLHAPGLEALADVGAVGCTLGEVRERANLVIFWGAESLAEHPRFFERFLQPASPFLPGGIQDRAIVGVAADSAPNSNQFGQFIPIPPSLDYEAIALLRSLVRGVAIDEAAAATIGAPIAELRLLAERMKNCRYGVILYGSRLAKGTSGARTIASLQRLVQELNAITAFNAIALRNTANGLGCDNILAWQTGYPLAVNFARGYPRSRIREFSVRDMLARREPDAALIIASDPLTDLPPAARDHLASIPYIAIDATLTATYRAAAVSLLTALPGLETGGTIYRLDDVPLPLRPVLTTSLPASEIVLQQILAAVAG